MIGLFAGLASDVGHVVVAADAAEPTGPSCRYQPIDDRGRCPLLTYSVAASKDDTLCQKVAEALNRAPGGERKLYSNSPFVPWREEYVKHPPPGGQPAVSWAAVDIFNDQRPVVLWKSHSEAGDAIRIFRDAGAFEESLTKGGNPGHEEFPNLIGEVTNTPGQVGFEAHRVAGFPILPPKLRASRRWKNARRSDASEFQVGSFAGSAYLAARIYFSEIIYVIKFQDDGSTDICYLAANRFFGNE